ncbi:MAG: VWA domain-containing protein [Anaerolineaceae bacterium]
MNEVEFARPWLLVGLLLVPLVVTGWALGVRRANRKMRAISRDRPGRPPYVAATLFAAAAMLSIVASALPQWGTTQSHLPRNGADLVVVLDISRSMDARDVQPSRLEAAKAALALTLTRLGGDRVGLVVFAGTSRVRFPLTTDLAAATQVISSLETGSIIVEGGTNATLGLDLAASAFEEGRIGGRAVLLLTDGDDLGGDPAASAERFRQTGIDLLVVGVGTAEGGRVPVIDPKTFRPGDKLDANGQPIVSKLSETFLQALAAASGGRYLGSELGTVPGAVAGRVQALKSAQVDERSATIPVERFQWFAGGALALLALASVVEWLERRGRQLGLAVTAVMALLLLAACATDAYSANEAGREALNRGDTGLAIEKFIEAQAVKPDDAQISLNLAAAYHAAERYDDATLAARRVTGSPASEDRAKAFASIGHHAFATGQLEVSLDAFHRALLEDPANETTRHDYEVVRRLIKPEEAKPADDTPPDASATPGPSSDGGQGSGTPAQTPAATPPPTQSGPPAASTPQSGPGTSRDSASVDKQLRDIDAQVARLVKEGGETPTAAQALEILRLLAERARIAAQRDGETSNNPRDY